MNARIYKEFPHRGWLAAAGLLLLAALALPAPAAAAERVGRAISSSGDVTAFRAGESARSLNRGDPVYEGDEIRTGPNGRAQVRFVDQGLTNLSPSTTLAVDEYRIEDDDADGGGSAVLSFLRGAMRTITGLIGDNDEDTYRMNTPTATIGVRGTGYALQYCDAACAQEFGGQPGLYGRVDDGAIRIDTPRGSTDFGSGSYFFVPDGGGPRGILQPPAGVLDGGEDEGGGDGGDTGDGVAIIPVGEQEGDDILLTEGDFDETDFEAGDEFVGFTGSIGAGVAAAPDSTFGGSFELFKEGGNFATNSNDQVTSATFSSGEEWKIDSVALEDTGSIDDLDVNWGRWTGTFLFNGQQTTGNLAFTYTENLTEVIVLSDITGTLSFDFAGGPRGFDTIGNLWTVDKLGLGVNFTDQLVGFDNTFQLSSPTGQVGSVTFNAGHEVAGSVAFDPSSSNFFSFTADNGSDDAQLNGQFVGINAEGMTIVFHVRPIRGDAPEIFGTAVLKQR